MINTGTLDVDWSLPVSNKLRSDQQSSSDFDWSQPVTTKLYDGKKSSDFDWSQSASSKLYDGQNSCDFDWSQPVSTTFNDIDSSQTRPDFYCSERVSTVSKNAGQTGTSSRSEYNGSSSIQDGFIDSSDEVDVFEATSVSQNNLDETNLSDPNESQNSDATSQRLKFRACLKVVVEELCTLPHHCEIYNKDLRSTFTAWLKRELDVIHRVCDFERDGRDPQHSLPLAVSTPTETGILQSMYMYHMTMMRSTE